MKVIVSFSMLFAVSIGYFISNEYLNNRDEAQAYCEGYESDLASIHDANQLADAQAVCRRKTHTFGGGSWGCWIGLSQSQEGEPWEWIDQTPFDYGYDGNGNGQATISVKPWADGEPNNEEGHEDCAMLGAHLEYLMNDHPCDGYQSYVLCNGFRNECEAQGFGMIRKHPCSCTTESDASYCHSIEIVASKVGTGNEVLTNLCT
eukprot:387505_1